VKLSNPIDKAQNTEEQYQRALKHNGIDFQLNLHTCQFSYLTMTSKIDQSSNHLLHEAQLHQILLTLPT
jgi:hypothetical protein